MNFFLVGFIFKRRLLYENEIADDFNFLANFFLIIFFWSESFLKAFIIWNWRWFQFFGELFFGNFLISFFVARYLTVSLRGPVLKPYDEGASPSLMKMGMLLFGCHSSKSFRQRECRIVSTTWFSVDKFLNRARPSIFIFDCEYIDNVNIYGVSYLPTNLIKRSPCRHIQRGVRVYMREGKD